jgi:hypothetical protein
MTSLAHETRAPAPAGLDLADKVGITIAALCVALAIALAIVEITGEAATDLPPLTPLAEGHDWPGFSA